MTVLEWLTSVWGIVPIAVLAVLYARSYLRDRKAARDNHPTAWADRDNDGRMRDGTDLEYPEMYR